MDQISRDLLATTLLKDPRTTYVHQSELAGDGTLLALLDAALEWYPATCRRAARAAHTVRFRAALLRQQAWAAAVAAGAVQAHRKGDVVVVEATREVAAPVTGAGDESYGDALSGWVSVGTCGARAPSGRPGLGPPPRSGGCCSAARGFTRSDDERFRPGVDAC